MKKQTLQIIIAIIVIALIITFVWLTGIFTPASTYPSEKVTTSTTPELVKFNSSLQEFPPEIQGEIHTLSDKYSITPDNWGFDPVNKEIDLLEQDLSNPSAYKDLSGKKIGNYSIHIFNRTELEITRSEVQDYLFQFFHTPDYQISNSITTLDTDGRPYVDVECEKFTPENKRLENTTYKGWRIHVYVCCGVPDTPGTYHNNAPQIASPSSSPTYTAISAGLFHSLALKSDGTIVVWGADDQGFQKKIPQNLTDLYSISAGYDYNLALKRGGSVIVWGAPASYSGIATLTNVSNISAISSGHAYGLALLEDGTVISRGHTLGGIMDVPMNLSNVKNISAGGTFALALKKDGTVVAWGDNKKGQTNVSVNQINVITIAAGTWHGLALKNDGTVIAWGDNENNQTEIPRDLKEVIAISAGGDHSLALRKDGTVIAWGDNRMGQSNVPADLHDVKAISAGGAFSLALKNDGKIVCWGANYSGQCDVPDQ